MQINSEEGSRVYYPHSGRLKSCVLSEGQTVQNVFFPAGSILGFTEEGALWRCNISEETTVQGFRCLAKSELEFSSLGSLLMCTLSDETVIEGVPAGAGSTVFFHENGVLFSCRPSRPLVIQGFEVQTGDVCFFEDRRLSAFDPREDISINGIPCMGGKRVWLHREGALACCTLADETEINGVTFPAETLIVLSEEGSVVHDCRAG
jgi:hypothetical protein